MKRLWLLFLSLLLLAIVLTGAVLAQEGPDPTAFTLERQIGQTRPQTPRYNPQFDQFAWVDRAGNLLLVDAADLTPQFTLYEAQTYSDYRFSNDGQWLAVAINTQVELWNTQTGENIASFEPDGTLSIAAPLQFSDDDRLLLVYSVTLAPRELRRSENDTVVLPWLWDLQNARREGRSRLNNGVIAQPFFDFRNSFVYMGPNDKLIAGLPGRVQILQATTSEVLAEVVSDRIETSPITAWSSQQGDSLYFQPTGRRNLVQVNTTTGDQTEIPAGASIDGLSTSEYESLVFSDSAQIVGSPVDTQGNTLLRQILGADYISRDGYSPQTAMLLDVLEPITPEAQQNALLMYVFSEDRSAGTFEFLRPSETSQFTLSPEGDALMMWRTSGARPIEIYDLETGRLDVQMFPTYADNNSVFDYDATGRVVISDFERFDAQTGDLLFQDITLNRGYEQFFLTKNGTEVITRNGADWWVWDVATGNLIRREQLLTRGSIIDTWPNGERFLTRVNDTTLEIVEIGTDERRSITFDVAPGQFIDNVLHNDDWTRFLVVFAPVQGSQHFPGNEIVMVDLDGNELWHLAGDDLPDAGATYQWLGNDTIIARSNAPGSREIIERVYGVEYHPSGLPACLVINYPEDFGRWLNVWERRAWNLRADDLNELALDVCEALEEAPPELQIQAVDEVMTTPTPTRQPTRAAVFVATEPAIAGVPTCLTFRFQEEALEYAEVWRAMAAGLNEAEIRELQTIVCEGVNNAGGVGGGFDVSFGGRDAAPGIMVIDAQTGQRTEGTFFPRRERTPQPSLELVLIEYERATFNRPNNARLSEDGQRLAFLTGEGFIQVWRLNRPYQSLADEITATREAIRALTPTAQILRLQPTVTPTFEALGGPRPTITPTITPTSPPLTNALYDLGNRDIVQDFCEVDAPLYTLENPPPNWNPTGRLFINAGGLWLYDFAAKTYLPNDTIPRPDSGNRTLSPDENWVLIRTDVSVAVSRPDGTDVRELYDQTAIPFLPSSVTWNGLNTLVLQVDQYDDRNRLRTFTEAYDPVTDTLSERFRPTERGVSVNDLPTEIVTQQPNNGPWFMVRTPLRLGNGTGYRYYMLYDDADPDEVTYFLRLDSPGANNSLSDLRWNPQGTQLFYRLTTEDGPMWFIFDTVTAEHRVFGESLPAGTLSRDWRYRAAWFSLGGEARAERLEAGLPLPKLQIYDTETGLTRRYCIPQTSNFNVNADLKWSPDNRYLIFRTTLPTDQQLQSEALERELPTPTPRVTPDPVTIRGESYLITQELSRTLVLDTETGAVTVIGLDLGEVITWTE